MCAHFRLHTPSEMFPFDKFFCHPHNFVKSYQIFIFIFHVFCVLSSAAICCRTVDRKKTIKWLVKLSRNDWLTDAWQPCCMPYPAALHSWMRKPKRPYCPVVIKKQFWYHSDEINTAAGMTNYITCMCTWWPNDWVENGLWKGSVLLLSVWSNLLILKGQMPKIPNEVNSTTKKRLETKYLSSIVYLHYPLSVFASFTVAYVFIILSVEFLFGRVRVSRGSWE